MYTATIRHKSGLIETVSADNLLEILAILGFGESACVRCGSQFVCTLRV